MTSPNSFSFTLKIIGLLLLISIGLSHSQTAKPSFTSLKAVCVHTLHPKTCYDILSPLTKSHQNTHDAQFLYNTSVHVAMDEISRVLADFTKNVDKRNCGKFLSLALHNLNRSLPTTGNGLTTRFTRTNFRTWLSGAVADLQTCKHNLKYAPASERRFVDSKLNKSTQLVSISLAIITKIDNLLTSRADHNPHPTPDREPDWMSSEYTKFHHNSKHRMTPHVVVAADGSGNYKTINEAINAVPDNNLRRFVIHVKKGVYNENVVVNEKKWNVLMYGDGMSQTIVSSDLCLGRVSTTIATATFTAMGQGFIAKYMGFRNTAGVAKGPAVALVSGSDQAVFYRCSIEGYQDTLYIQNHRNFFRECKIYGTVDFIYGEGAGVIQNSQIIVRRPPYTITVITAQGKSDPNSVSGLTIQNSSIVAAPDLGPNIRTFLGRPWKDYSTVVFAKCDLGSLVDPEGWMRWTENKPFLDTTLYVEDENRGPGANTTKRVKVNALRINDVATASKYTVKSFLGGDQWIPRAGVPFQADL